MWFQGGSATRKARNLARDPRCSIARQLTEYDLVIEGVAVKVNDPARVVRVTKHWADRDLG